MKRVSAQDIHRLKLGELQLDGADLGSTVALAEALRRAAGFLCPCAPQTLVRALAGPLEDLVLDPIEARERIEETLEALLSVGDLIENRETREDELTTRTLIHSAPPAFVARGSGGALLLGVAPDGLSPLPEELRRSVQRSDHVRRLSATVGDVGDVLEQLGLIELSFETWLAPPAQESSARHVSRINAQLDRAGNSGEIPGLTILDPATPVRYYRGRWTPPKRFTGRFVARREQAYGADLWCFVELVDGQPKKLLDLPPQESRWRGCDHAWHLQMAIDSMNGRPQGYRATVTGDVAVVEFFSPVPMWARRRWDAIGTLVERRGCLFAYAFAANELEEEVRFAQQWLWLQELS